jgi:hypothetical protein
VQPEGEAKPGGKRRSRHAHHLASHTSLMGSNGWTPAWQPWRGRYQVEARQNRLIDSTVWLYRPTRTSGRSPKLQSSWEGPYKGITRINDVVYRIQRHPRLRMIVVHLDRLAPYLGAAWDEQP